MPYILDTDWSIQAISGRMPAAAVLLQIPASQVVVSIITIGELYAGAFNSSNPPARLERLRQFLMAYRLLPLTEAIMETFAEARAHLRRRGLLIPDFDLVIGATALVHDLTVLTFNRRHFSRIPGLRLYDPT